MKRFSLLSICIFSFFFGESQEKATIEFDGYIDSYYASYNDDLPIGDFQLFSTVSPRDNQFGINIAQIGLHYTSSTVRSNLTIHHGDIAIATWSSRYQNIQEANVGVHIYSNWWLDGGLFTTHVGTESFLPKNNDLSSTAVLTYNEPSFQAGAKVAYEGSEKYDLEFWVVNGYNFFEDVNKAKSVGLLFSYHINKNTSVTYTNLIGDEAPFVEGSDLKQIRSYHNIYVNSTIKKMVKLTLGFDYATQSNTKNNFTDPANMMGFLGTAKVILTDKASITARYEMFQDKDGFISGFYNEVTNTFNLELQAYTLGMEYKPQSNSYLRVEGRYMKMTNNMLTIFNNSDEDARMEVMVTTGVFFDKKW